MFAASRNSKQQLPVTRSSAAAAAATQNATEGKQGCVCLACVRASSDRARAVGEATGGTSLGHVGGHLLLQALGEAVVEEEELAVRKQAAEHGVDAAALQQHLDGGGRSRGVVRDDPS